MLREPELQPEGASEDSASEDSASGNSASGNKRPRKVSHRRNVITSYLGAISIAAVSFLITPVLTHQLGILRYGVWALIGSLIPFLEILELGFASATMAFVSRHLELEDDDSVTSTLNTSFLCLSVLGFVAFAGVMVFAYFLPDIIPTIPKSLVGQAQFLLLLKLHRVHLPHNGEDVGVDPVRAANNVQIDRPWRGKYSVRELDQHLRRHLVLRLLAGC